MKKIYFIALILCVGINAFAIADPGATEIQPPMLPTDTHCNLSLGSGVVDYGNHSRGQLQDASPGGNTLTLGKRTLTLSVVCPYAQPLRLVLNSDRTANGEVRYGEQSRMVVRLFDMQRDGQAIQLMAATPSGGLVGTATDSLLLQPGQAVVAALNGRLVEGKVFNARLEIEPILTNKEARVSVQTTKESLLTLVLSN